MKFNLNLTIINLLITVMVFHGTIALLFPWTNNLNDREIPFLLIISRDLIFLIIVLIILSFNQLGRIKIIPKYVYIFPLYIICSSLLYGSYHHFSYIHHIYRNLLMYWALIFLIPITINTFGQIKIIIKHFENLVLICCLIGIFTLENNAMNYFGRVYSTLYTPNTLASVLSLFAIINIIRLIILEKDKASFTLVIKISILLFGIQITGAITSIIAFIFALFFAMYILKVMINFKIILYKFFLTFTMFVCFNFIFPNGLTNTLQRIKKILFDNDSTSINSRIEQNKDFISSLQHNPIDVILLGPQSKTLLTNDGMYLQLFNQIGILGTVIYIVFILGILFESVSFSHKCKRYMNNENHKYLFIIFTSFSAFIFSQLIISFFSISSFYHYPINAMFGIFTGLLFLAKNLLVEGPKDSV